MGVHDVDGSRRAFLARLVAGGAVSAAACFAGPKPARAGPGEGPYSVEIIDEPIVLRSGETLVDRCFVPSERFLSGWRNAIIAVEGDGVAIRNVRIVGADRWDSHWNDLSDSASSLPGVFGNTVGIRIQNVRDVVVERVSIEGLPRAGIAGFGITGGLFRDIAVRHCRQAINLVYYSPSSGLTITRVHASDMWGASGDPSRARPGGWIGSDGLALNSLRDSMITDCVAIGEMYSGLKMTNPQRVTVRRFRGCGLQVQGLAAGGAAAGMVPARDVLIEDCVLDKGLGYGASVRAANAVQITNQVASVVMRRCLLSAANTDGHGIQVTAQSNARIVGCTIRGFNGMRGTHPAHALDIAPGSTANGDFAAANIFVDQRRIVLDRT